MIQSVFVVPTTGYCRPHPDAELIRSCREFGNLEIEFLEIFEGSNRIEDDVERNMQARRITVAQTPLLARMKELHATTLEGFLARVRNVGIENPEFIKGMLHSDVVSDEINQQNLACLLRDMMQMAETCP